MVTGDSRDEVFTVWKTRRVWKTLTLGAQGGDRAFGFQRTVGSGRIGCSERGRDRQEQASLVMAVKQEVKVWTGMQERLGKTEPKICLCYSIFVYYACFLLNPAYASLILRMLIFFI